MIALAIAAFGSRRPDHPDLLHPDLVRCDRPRTAHRVSCRPSAD
jgi:hypothetical protein